MTEQSVKKFLLCVVMLAMICPPTAYTDEEPAPRRLFDRLPAGKLVEPQTEGGKAAQPKKLQSSRLSARQKRYFLFNGVVSSSQVSVDPGSSNNTLLINGYPFDESALPEGVSAVKWHPELEELEVTRSNGSRDYLSPGDSVLLGSQR